MNLSKPLFSLVILAIVFSLGACSGGKTPITPKADDNAPISFGVPMDGRNVVAIYDAVIDPEAKTFTITPETRSNAYHFPLTQLYPNVLQIIGYGWTPTFWADIRLNHPFPGSGIDGFDPRVIAIIPANPGVSFYYPYLNVRGNNAAVRAHDGYTFLFDEIGGGIPGNVNPFMCYFRDEPFRIWSSTGMTSETRRWSLNLAGFGGPITYKLVVDVSSNYPAPPQPVIDNAKEPLIVDWFVGEGLTPAGGVSEVGLWLLDWQGPDDIGCEMECPALFEGRRSIYFIDNPEPNIYFFYTQIFNEKLAPVGEYPIIFAVWDMISNIYNYREGYVIVQEPSEQHVRPVKFKETLPDDVWFDICVQNDGPVYVVADHPATGNVGGSGEDGHRTALKFSHDLEEMAVINPEIGMASPLPENWEYEGEFRHLDVSPGGFLINDVGGNTISTWIVTDNTATVGTCCWQTHCMGLMATIADVTDHIEVPTYGTGTIGFATINPGCPLIDWAIAFPDSDPTWYSGLNTSNNLGDRIFDDINSVAGIDGLTGIQNILVFYTSDTEAKLAEVGPCYDTDGNMDIQDWTGSLGSGPGQFQNGLDVTIDGNGFILTLDFLVAESVFRFQKFEPNFDHVYESIWRSPGEPMRMDFDKSSNMLYLLCDIGIYICEVD